MKIGFFLDKWQPGHGTENQILGMIRGLEGRGVQCEIFALRASDTPCMPPCSLTEIGISSLFSRPALRSFFNLLNEKRKRDLDVAMVYFQDSNLFFVPLCRLAGVRKIVVNRRDMGFWHSKGTLLCLRLVNIMADLVLANSHAVKRVVHEKEKISLEKIEVLWNGLWDEGFTEDFHPSSPPPWWDPDTVILAYVASLQEVKRPRLLLDIMNKVLSENRRCRLVIAGDGPLRSSLQKYSQELGISDSVVFLGQVGDVASLLRFSDIGLLVSESEGLSNSLMEYSAAGLPVVTFDVGGNQEIVCDGETGYLIPEGDLPGFVRKVLFLLNEPQKRSEMGNNGRRYIFQRFGATRILDAFLDLLKG